MKVKVEDLETGLTLYEDVLGLSGYPIIPKNTVLTNEHIEILKAFSIPSVDIKSDERKKSSIKTESQSAASSIRMQDSEINTSKPTKVFDLYMKGVASYEREFKKWQSGLGIDINAMRKIILPLIKTIEFHKDKLIEILDYATKEKYLYHHAVAVGMISSAIAQKMKLGNGTFIQVALAGLLADCGMAKINVSLINKPEKLIYSQYNDIKQHVIHSYNMVRNINLLRPETKLSILQHHERLDGSGYPLGEKGKRIHLLSQIVGIVDLFHAMVSERVYKKKQPLFKVLEMIHHDFFGQFDIQVVNTLLSVFAHLSIGTKIKLMDQRTATVLFVNNNEKTRPIIKIEGTNEVIDMAVKRDLWIDKVL
ncbi:MAG: HD domain-containing protein [Bacillales bacterium]|nr:HD domain-containing protein [Bacillales bacterium]